MKKPLIAASTLVALLVAVLLLPLIRPVQAASAGCQQVSSLSGDYAPGSSRSLGLRDFSAGDKINLSVTIDGANDLRLVITGAATYDNTSGNPQSFDIPSDGQYDVTVENTLGQAINGVNVSCTASGVVPTEDVVAQTSTRFFFETQEAASTIAAQTAVAGATQTMSNLLTQTEIAGQTATAAANATNLALTPSPTLTPTPSPTLTPTPSPTFTPTPWPGYFDGRLSAQIDEEFTLRCENNLLSIYRAVNGQGQLLMTYPIRGLESRAMNWSTTLTSPSGSLTLGRLQVINPNDQLFFVSGYIGTNAPNLGYKAFLLEQCISTNGGMSVLPTQTSTPVPSVTPRPPASIVNNLSQQPSPQRTDTDGDGISNIIDLCPAVYAPVPLQFGCPDSDGDGLSDPLDRCPREPSPGGLGGGCPDYDGDGFFGANDYCPTNAGPALGCNDPDGDGYPNHRTPDGQYLDWCPLAGRLPNVTHFMGCPDPDRDGKVEANFRVPDAFTDPCPLSPANTLPCTPPTEITANVVVNSPAILFEFANAQGGFGNLVINTVDGTACNKVVSGVCVQLNVVN